MTQAGDPEHSFVRTQWVGVDDVPLLVANQFAVQLGAGSPEVAPEDLFLVVGQVAPPLLVGTEEEQRAQFAEVTAVPIRTLARLSLTRQRAVELAAALSQLVEQYDAARTGGTDD